MSSFKEIYRSKVRSLPTASEQVINEFMLVTGKSRSSIGNWLAGRSIPDPTSAKVLEEYLGVPASELFPGTKYAEREAIPADKTQKDKGSTLRGNFHKMLNSPGIRLTTEARFMYERLLWLFEEAGWPASIMLGDYQLAGPCGVETEDVRGLRHELEVTGLIRAKQAVIYDATRPPIMIYSLPR